MRPFSIQVIEKPDNAPLLTQWVDGGGRLFLDIDDEFRTQLTKNINELTDVNEIKVDSALGSSFPPTNKNIATLFDDLNYALEDNNDPDDREIRFDAGGYYPLQQDTLRVVQSNVDGRIECDFIESEDHWIEKLSSLYLDDLPFQPFEMSNANLINNMLLYAKYTPGDPGYWFPLIHFGQQTIPNQYSISDFRPMVHSAKIYELTAKEIGYTIKFPLLETEIGRRHINYLLKQKINDDVNQLETMKFKAVIDKKHDFQIRTGSGDYVNEIIQDYTELLDNGNNFDADTGVFDRPGYYKFNAKIKGRLVIDASGIFNKNNTDVTYNLVHLYADGTKILVGGERRFSKEQTTNIDITFSENILIKPGDKVYLEYNAYGDDVVISWINKVEFWNEPINVILSQGDIINVQRSLRHDTLLDMIKGDVHLFNLKIYYDQNERTIWFLTPYDMEYYGDSITGFFKDVTDNVITYQLNKAEAINTPAKYEKNIIYKFKETTDPYVKKKEEEAGILENGGKEYKSTFCKFIDHGFEKDGENVNESRENPYWEATINDDPGITTDNENVLYGTQVLDIPFMLDNLEKNISYNIGPRKLIAYGMSEQYAYVSDTNHQSGAVVQVVRILDQDLTAIPYAFMYPNGYTVFDSASSTLSKPEEKMIYGEDELDHYEMFYRRERRDFENRHKSTLNMLVPMDFFFSETFRNRKLAWGVGGYVMGRFTSLNKYDLDTGLVEVDFIPDPLLSDDCVMYPEPVTCKNYPVLIVNKVGDTYYFSMGGINQSVISTLKFQYKYQDDTGDFIDLDPAQLVNPTETFIVRMIVTYVGEDCHEEIRTRVVDPCGNTPDICFQLIGNCLTITECGSHNSTISNTIIQYTIGTAPPAIYTDCIDISTIPKDTVIKVEITVTYVGGCKPVTVTDYYRVGNYKESDCPEVDDVDTPGVVGVTTAQGIELVRTGKYVCCAADDFIKYRKKGSNEEWKRWVDGLSPTQQPYPLTLNQDYEMQRVIIWCAKNCAPWCSPVYYAYKTCSGTLNYTDSITSCTNTLKWVHPDTGLTNWKVSILDDQRFFVPECKTYIERNCASVITQLNEKTIIYDRWNFRTQYQYSWQEDYRLESMEVHQNIAGTVGSTITIPLNITFNSGDSNDYLTLQIYNAVGSYLSTNYSAVNGTDFDFEVELIGTGSTRTLKLIWWAKHVVSESWIGAQAPGDLLYVRNPSDVQSTVASSKLEAQKDTTSIPVSTNKSECGNEFKVRLSAGVNKFLDDSASNFDTFTAYATVAISATVLSALSTDTCNKHTLGVTFTCSPGPASYLWKDGEIVLGTSSTLVASGVGKVITLIAICGSCAFKKLITLS